jgi:5-methylcytosine-specific restriction endonuclease McrA
MKKRKPICQTIRIELYNLQNSKCQNCKKKFVINQLVTHHKLPLTFGGNQSKVNLELLCLKCHSKKHKLIREKFKNGN